MMRGYVFDLDGVLVDTARFHYLAWKRLAREWFAFDFTPGQNEAFKGVNREACMRLLCDMAGASLSPEEFARGMALKNGWYIEMLDGMTPRDALPGARDYVLRAKAAGLRCAIGSASKNCRLALEKTCLAPLFDAVADGVLVTRAKPDPEVFLAAARLLDLSPESCLVFEDSQAGLDAARRGGMKSCAIGSPETLRGWDAIAPNLADCPLFPIKDEFS